MEDYQTKVILLQAQNEAIYERVAHLYEESKKINTKAIDLRSTETFMADTEILNTVRQEFRSNLDNINAYSLRINPKYKVDYQSLISLDSIYARVERVRSLVVASAAINTTSSHSQDNASQFKGCVKLPPIQIPFFDGRIENWPIFYESFKTNIHLNVNLTDSQRVQYLVGKLSGSSLKLIAGIIPSGENYNSIWDSLVQKYQDVRALGIHYMSNILNVKPATNNSSSLNTFIENFHASVSALEQLNFKDLKDFILLNLATRKIDSTTANLFEMSMRDKEVPCYKDFVDFIKSQVKILERTAPSYGQNSRISSTTGDNTKNTPLNSRNIQPRNTVHHSLVIRDNTKSLCSFCNKADHYQLYICPSFKSNNSKSRLDFIKNKRGCVNCLSLTHTTSNCRSTYVCKICQKRHHTLLHLNNSQINKSCILQSELTPSMVSVSKQLPQTSISPAESQQASVANTPQVALCARSRINKNVYDNQNNYSTILLSTAQVYVTNNFNQFISVRCVLDSGSQNNIITSACCKQLGLNIIPLVNSFIKGVGSISRPILGYVHIKITSKINNNTYNITALVVDYITDRLPTQSVDVNIAQHLINVPLADPLWYVPGEVELLIGAQLFPFLLLGGKILSPPAPSAIETVFGYIIIGDVPAKTYESNPLTTALHSSTFFTTLEDSLEQFWILEEIPAQKFMSTADTECEQLFSTSVSRDCSGRYSLALPFSKDPKLLGNSYAVAHRRLLTLENKLKNPELRASYNAVIQDYIDNNYLSPVSPIHTSEGYYIPHHPIIRQDKTTTKVRIVLDASAKCHNGLSLNDILHTGPNLQADLFNLLLKFRLFPIAITADIKQMYLQIGVCDSHKIYQKILYRFNTSDPIQEFQFKRIAFGLKSCPFLAMRTVRQLSADEKDQFPRAAMVASSEMYMDDLATSVESVTEAKELTQELIALFKAGGFDLTKWASNSQELLASVLPSSRAAIDFSDNINNLKILGLEWIPAEDSFTFTTSPVEETCTKRSILSTIARLWDVLGFAAPVILYAKLLVKELWNLKTGWDETPSESIISQFQTLKIQLHLLSLIKIPRHVAVTMGCTTNIVGFADASMKAYGCVVYLHVIDSFGNVHVRLVCAKSKVAPIKVVSLARLELCAALLMSKLIKLVYDSYRIRTAINDIFAFSDSKITLSWIHSSPHRWNIFVSNRVSKCHENLDPKHFYHVSGKENPSDCLSRGLLPEQLLSQDIWWHGPKWLCCPVRKWPITPFTTNSAEELPEINNKTLTCTASVESNLIYNLSQRFSSWNKILRIIVYILRFARIIPREQCHEIISISQLNIAETYLIRAVQQINFHHIIEQIKKDKLHPPLKRLDLFIDTQQIIRIGGRLSNANLPYEAQHPALLPKHDYITHLLIDYFHRIYCHTGANLLSSLIRQKYWILSSRSVIRQRVHGCNTCFKTAPTFISPKMADLPPCRVQETKAFVHTGVDYAGPIKITPYRSRGQRSVKAYICLFVCFTTKAVHIEFVTDVSSDTFISAFKRFISRRGPVSCLYSDNGTNFVGAKNQLQEFMSNNFRIQWKMIPPRAPHFGGLWESNIKSIKTHLYRVIGSQLLTYEEMITVLTQIEAVLNSRPLCVLTEDPYPEPLTPAHFIMASPLTSLPVHDVPETAKSLRCRKQLLDQMICSYWKRWRTEYLHNLQVRQKWLSNTATIKIGTVVLIHQDDVPPLRWPLGIITQLYPGKDGISRVALVKSTNGSFKRPIIKLCPLPSQ